MILSIGHIARSCCFVVPVALLNKELRTYDKGNKASLLPLGISLHLGTLNFEVEDFE